MRHHLNNPLYSIAQVEALTRIKGHTIRIWERRYSFLKPQRTDTNIRTYSDDELRLLISIGMLNRNGLKISKIDRLTLKEINEQALALANDEQGDQVLIDRLTLRMLKMDEQGLLSILDNQIKSEGIYATTVELIYPFLKHVGVLWSTFNAMPAQEHFVTNLIRRKIWSAIDQLPQPKSNAKSALLFLTEEEDHELGLLLAAYLFREHGWHVIYLGQRVPANNVLEVARIKNPTLTFTILTSPLTKKYEEQLKKIQTGLKTHIVASGNSENFTGLQEPLNQLRHLESPEDLLTFLKNQ